MSRGSPGIRRIRADIRELSVDPSDQYHAAPLEHDMFEWHFTIRGAPGTDFEDGVYHGRILLPPEYPFKPPDIVFLTPSGRFECGVKVCLSFSAHHPELWQPAWGIRLILEALISFLPTPADGAIGALDWTSDERKKMAKASTKFRCSQCCDEGQTCAELLPPLRAQGDGAPDEATKKMKFHKQIEELKMLQFQNHSEKGIEDAAHSAKQAEKEGATEDNQPPILDDTEVALKPPPELLQGSESKPMEVKTDQSLQVTTTTPSNFTPQKAPQQRANDNKSATEPRDHVPRPPPIPESGAQITADTVTNTTPAGATNGSAPLVSDSVLNVMIGFFGVFVLVLIKQAQLLVGELNEMDEDMEGTWSETELKDIWNDALG